MELLPIFSNLIEEKNKNHISLTEDAQLYSQTLSISVGKYNYLVNLCKKGAISDYFHDISVIDRLPEIENENETDSEEED